MQNYQKLYFNRYYIMAENGESVECTRRECFAPAEEPTADNPFKQRWYYSPDPQRKPGKPDERGRFDREMAIRLPRNAKGEELHKMNAADLKAEERYAQRFTKRGFIEIDKTTKNEDGEDISFDIPDDADSPAEILIKQETHTAIRIAIDALTPDERHLWNDLLSEKTKAKIAEECGLSEGAIRKRVKKLAATLRENPGLKNYF